MSTVPGLLTENKRVTTNVNTTGRIKFRCLSHSVSKIMGTFVVTTCLPLAVESETYKLCTMINIFKYGSWVVGDTGRVYFNKFCAWCNNITRFRYFSIQVHQIEHLDITDEVNKTQKQKLHLIKRSKVKLEYIPPAGVIPRTCIKADNVITYSERCFNYGLNPVIEKSILYRNYHCSRQTANDTRCVEEIKNTENLYGLFPMAVLFQFTGEDSISSCLEKVSFKMKLLI